MKKGGSFLEEGGSFLREMVAMLNYNGSEWDFSGSYIGIPIPFDYLIISHKRDGEVGQVHWLTELGIGSLANGFGHFIFQILKITISSII